MLSRPLLATALLLTIAGPADAQSWPDKQPIRVILPFSPGSALDTLG
jgi:tripartite-type tricarboxylate transporter receptor subunit TctC